MQGRDGKKGMRGNPGRFGEPGLFGAPGDVGDVGFAWKGERGLLGPVGLQGNNVFINFKFTK
jgi:Collagen triple helix repeat (20 copies)